MRKLYFAADLIYFSFSVIIINTAFAQESRFHINYIGQIATGQDLTGEKSVLSNITDYFFGSTSNKLIRPFSLSGNIKKDIWVLDQGNNCIMHIDNRKRIFNTLDCEKFNFQSLVGICLVNTDTIVFSDSKLEKLFIFNTSDQEIDLLSDSLHLSMPTGVAYNKQTNTIWVVETGAHRITLLTRSGQIIKRLGGRGTAKGMFNFPNFIWIDKKGTAYVVDSMNFRIQIFDAAGNFVSMFGEAGDASGYFAKPKGIATDSYGHIYVVDALFNTVQIFDNHGNYLSNFGSRGSASAQFLIPAGIFIDSTDHIYIADSYNARIQIFELSEN